MTFVSFTYPLTSSFLEQALDIAVSYPRANAASLLFFCRDFKSYEQSDFPKKCYRGFRLSKIYTYLFDHYHGNR